MYLVSCGLAQFVQQHVDHLGACRCRDWHCSLGPRTVRPRPHRLFARQQWQLAQQVPACKQQPRPHHTCFCLSGPAHRLRSAACCRWPSACWVTQQSFTSPPSWHTCHRRYPRCAPALQEVRGLPNQLPSQFEWPALAPLLLRARLRGYCMLQTLQQQLACCLHNRVAHQACLLTTCH
jgi:hypothetical protein